ncbi:hypothetical protein EJ08DRAFT_694980 [Tothia fuscella]|uniref:Uncharacterized protein n=1 Tax=Tothia fuscella TaxID=1048955 RepID=A0A9P4NX06_9PEZI|nr:hypothetical protein EJ08DRAFT_694980 [Tothia fuscella]
MSELGDAGGVSRQGTSGSVSRQFRPFGEPRDGRSPTMLREASADPYSPTPLRTTTDMVEQLLGGFRATIHEHRVIQDRLISDHRIKEEKMMQNVVNTVRAMNGLPTVYQSTEEDVSDEDVERPSTEYFEAEEVRYGIDRDSVFGIQDSRQTREVSNPRMEDDIEEAQENTRAREVDRPSAVPQPFTPAPEERNPYLILPPYAWGYPSSVQTPTNRGPKRKRTKQVAPTAAAGPSGTSSSSMGPPAPRISHPPTRKAALSSAKRTKELTEFLLQEPRAQSEALADGAYVPYVRCNCRQRSCRICGPNERARKDDS